MVRVEAEVLMRNQKKPAKKEPGSYQEKQRQSDLASDEYGSQAAKRTARRGRAAFVLEIRVDIGSRCVQRRSKATQHSTKQRDGQGKDKNAPIPHHSDR